MPRPPEGICAKRAVSRVHAETFPELYLSCGLYDPYGNFEGSERFAQRAETKGISVIWQPLYGGHCAVDIASVATRLLRD